MPSRLAQPFSYADQSHCHRAPLRRVWGAGPLGDLTKPQVYALAGWVNREREIIPRFCLERLPSAELRPDQVDPFDYETVAPELDELVGLNQSDAALRRSEHKRWQMGIVLKVSAKSFGTGRLVPVSRK